MAYHKLSKPSVRITTLNKYNSKCAYCGSDLDLTTLNIDHIEPLRRHINDRSKKGDNNLSNYNPSCQSCNSSKGSMNIEKWRSEIEKKIDRLKRDSSTFRLLIRFGLINTSSNSVKFYFETLNNE